MKQQNIDAQLIRGVIASLGFPADRVERAVAVLLNEKAELSPGCDISPLLSFSDVQAALSVSKSTLRRMIIDGKLRPVRITQRRIGFRRDEVMAFITSLAHDPPRNQDNGHPEGIAPF